MMDNPRLRGGFGGIGDEEGFDELEDPMTGEGPAGGMRRMHRLRRSLQWAGMGGMGGFPGMTGHAADGKSVGCGEGEE